MPAAAPRTWILTSSPDNHVATAERGFSVIGIKERNRARALQMEPGDRIVLYLTKVMRFAAAIRIAGELYEDRERIWPGGTARVRRRGMATTSGDAGGPGKADAYPWRFETEPELVLEQPSWLAAESVKDDLEHIRKWPAEHWKLAFQGQLRIVSDADAALLMDRMHAASGVPA